MNDASPVLQLVDVRLSAGKRVLLDVPAFALAPGEVVAIVGPNGAGKSTLLRVAGLLQAVDCGQVTIAGEAATKRNALALRRRLAMVFQAPLLFDLEVRANAASGLRFRGIAREEAAQRAQGWLERFGVGHLARRGSRGLSGGEAQRVSLARAFATAPLLLLLDEPFSALDAPTRAELVPELIAHLRATNTAALIVSHDIAEAARIADRIAVMADGRIVQIGDLATLRSAPASPDVARLFQPYSTGLLSEL